MIFDVFAMTGSRRIVNYTTKFTSAVSLNIKTTSTVIFGGKIIKWHDSLDDSTVFNLAAVVSLANIPRRLKRKKKHVCIAENVRLQRLNARLCFNVCTSHTCSSTRGRTSR